MLEEKQLFSINCSQKTSCPHVKKEIRTTYAIVNKNQIQIDKDLKHKSLNAVHAGRKQGVTYKI